MPRPTDLLLEVGSIRENASSLEMLERRLRSPLGVVPFVGAGLSKPLGFPLWSEFLLEQGGLANIRETIQARIERGQYEEAAEDLQGARGGRRLEDAISWQFSLSGRRPTGQTSAVDVLPLFASGPVITTNFDPALEAAFEKASLPFAQKLCGARLSAAVQALQDNARLLIKIHGDFADPQDRILTLSQYEMAYGSADPARVDLSKPLPRLLRLIIQSRPLFFLGCSLNQDRTVRVLGRVTQEYPELAHYALVELPAEEAAVAKRDKFLSDHGIRPIWYPTGRHDLVASIVQQLVSRAHVARLDPAPRALPEHQALTSQLGAELRAAGYSDPRLSSLWIEEEIGKTNHSQIYRATIADQMVVVKKTRRDSCSLSALQRLEGKLIAAPSGHVSAQVATPLWVGVSAGFVLEIQPFFLGIPLDRMIYQGPSRVHGDLLEDIYRSLIHVVHRIHELDVLHRDVCPSNVLISGQDGQVRLTLIDCSFGWCVDETDQIPVSNDNYTAPEQLAGQALPSSDWYGVAGTCYFLANAVPPDLKNEAAFAEGLSNLGPALYSVVEGLLQEEPAERPQSLWAVLPREITRELPLVEEPLLGVFDLGAAGAIFMRADYYTLVSRGALASAVTQEMTAGRIPDPRLGAYLEQLVAQR